MANFKVVDEAYKKYEMITWQGEVEFEGENILYRYSEDNNGTESFVFADGDWVTDHPFIPVLEVTVMEWGTPTEFGAAGEECEIDV